MMKPVYRGRLLASTLLISCAAFAAPAAAQTVSGSADDVSIAQDDATESQTSSEIVVTGSRLARPDIESAAPVAVVGAEEIALQSGSANIENVLNDLPQVTATTSSTSNNPGGGVATVNLRALGASRTLTLVDGKRYVSYDVTQQVDLNTIPAALVERVDVVTGGRSAVYGSDAIAGVVNFILKKDFQGIDLQSQYNVSERGDAQIWDVNATIGANVEDGRGNATVHVGYLKRSGTFAGARDFGINALTNLGGNPPTIINGGSGFVPQTRVVQPGLGALLGFGTDSLDFNPDGSLGPYVPTDAYNFQPINYLQVPQERFLVSAQAHYEVTEAIVPYISAQFINNRVTQELAPTPIGNTVAFGQSANGVLGGLTVQTNSPFLAPSVRAAFQALDAAETNAATRNNGYITVPSFSSRTLALGPRRGEDDRNAYRIMAGLRGDLGGGWSYDGSYMYARTKNAQRQSGNVALSNFLAATNNSFQNPTTGAISPFPFADVPNGGVLVCTDPAARAAGCVPANIFGLNNISPEAIEYLGIGATNLQEYTTEHAIIALTNPRLLDFGTGPVGLAIGGEWRREAGSVTPDTFLASGNVAGFNPGQPTAGAYTVKEAFAEVNIPLANNTFVHLAELNLAGRVSDYSNAPGTVYTYAINGIFAPVRDLTLRGQYSRAIRGPSVNELFLGNTVSAAVNIDGCGAASAAPGGSLNAFCIAQGVPAAVLADPVAREALSNPVITAPTTFLGGNPNLREETATTWTVGGVFAPTFLRGFTATVDYYNIEIEDYISRIGTANIGAACFEQQLQNFCSLLTRNSLGQLERINDLNANSGGLKTTGIDVGVNYTHRPESLFGIEGGSIGFSFQGSRLLSYDYTPVLGLDIVRECAGRYGLFCTPASAGNVAGVPLPKWRHNARLSLGSEMARASLQWRYLGSVRDSQDAVIYAVERLPEMNYFDLTFGFSPTETFDLNFGVANLTDKQPPLLPGSQSGGSGEQNNTFPSVYDVIGRSFFVSTRVRF
ncbi:TonB-dependent receptor [Sphingomonas baiyangensis]|uniref:TonB-dependent receptor n=2 Tax=Sphingomonas baiyangensis TaxID=2572576 RepID=A0A4U1L5X4_9SPHN|nr:TonB-dependent receptor [Sphingomonas baiyangensis]